MMMVTTIAATNRPKSNVQKQKILDAYGTILTTPVFVLQLVMTKGMRALHILVPEGNGIQKRTLTEPAQILLITRDSTSFTHLRSAVRQSIMGSASEKMCAKW